MQPVTTQLTTTTGSRTRGMVGGKKSAGLRLGAASPCRTAPPPRAAVKTATCSFLSRTPVTAKMPKGIPKIITHTQRNKTKQTNDETTCEALAPRVPQSPAWRAIHPPQGRGSGPPRRRNAPHSGSMRCQTFFPREMPLTAALGRGPLPAVVAGTRRQEQCMPSSF